MKIDLNELSYKDKIDIDESFSYNKDELSTSSIQKLDNVKAKGYIRLNAAEEYEINIDVNGSMELLDSITLEPINYDFSFTINDNLADYLENNENLLDIKEFLWQNIVLEVPIRYTKSDADNLKGDHWKVINESEEKEIDPRLEKLNELFKGGE